MTKKSRRNQPVCFNMDDDYERELFEYAQSQQKYFSRYVKRLIEMDRAGVQRQPQVIEQQPPIEPQDTPKPRAVEPQVTTDNKADAVLSFF